jgi:NAD kinase
MKKIEKIVVVYYARNYGTLAKVKKVLKDNKLSVSYVKRENESVIRKLSVKVDVVVVVGGDGTFLKAAHNVEKTPVLHISSDYTKNEGFFARATNKDMKRKIGLLVSGKYKTMPLMRLDALINGKKIPFSALNEVYVGTQKAYHTAKYVLVVGKKREEQKSSGVLISTPCGSTAWIKSSGGRKLSIKDKRIQYVVREPYTGRLTRPKMIRGIVSGSGNVKVVSEIWNDQKGVVVIDSSTKEFSFNKGSALVVNVSKQPLNLIYF